MTDTPTPFVLPPEPPAISTLAVASLPFAFTQHPPLTTSDFIKEATRRGYDLDLAALQDLYRHRLLMPFTYVGSRAVTEPVDLGDTDLFRDRQSLVELRVGRSGGRLVDLAAVAIRPWIRFEEPKVHPRRWWNGLLYSQHQLLALPSVKDWLSSRYRLTTWRKMIVREAAQPLKPDAALLRRMNGLRRVAAAVTAFEARYLPNLDREWVRPVHVAPEAWVKFREAYDPSAVADRIGYTPSDAREDAERLLTEANWIDPIDYDWGRLVWRAPQDKWERFKNDALLALDFRQAAEILLRFYEDMADRGAVEALPNIAEVAPWQPPARLSDRRRTLGEDLMHLGISPHPRVVLAVEGETEAEHMPLVWKALDYPEAPELVRLQKLGGVDKGPVKIGGHVAAPLVSRKDPGGQFWWLIKPPTCFMLAVDPEGKYYADNKYVATRQLILDEIKDVLAVQGADGAINDDELQPLVEIHRWGEACYEFEHFTDEELADGLMEIHYTVGGMTRDELITKIAAERGLRNDIKRVWRKDLWGYEPSKTKLAKALWPVLEAKIQRAKIDSAAPIPAIAGVVQHAFHVAQNWRYKSFVLGLNPEETVPNGEQP